jgi:hypothetical protein
LAEFIYAGNLFNSTNFQMYVNGTAQPPAFTGSSTAFLFTSPGIAVGTVTGAPNVDNFTGDVAEVVVYLTTGAGTGGALTTVQRQQVESYFSTRYGV